MRRYIFGLAICLVLSLTLLHTTRAFAGNTDNCRSPQLPWSGTLNTETTANLHVGDVIPGSDASLVVNINCSEAWDDNQAYCSGGIGWNVHPNAPGIETSVPGAYTFSGLPSGVAYQFLDEGGSPIPLGPTNRHDTGVPIQTGEQVIPLRFRMVRVAGDLSTGSFNVTMGIGCENTEYANINNANSLVHLMINATVITQTCSLNNPDVQVQLPEVARSDFKGVGSGAGAKPFMLDFQCDANTDARFNISDITDLGNSSDVITLLESSSASGIGVRLLHEGNPVRLAPNQVFNQGSSEFPLRNLEASQRLISLPFSAEYVQTEVPVRSGSVQAQAIVTIDYN